MDTTKLGDAGTDDLDEYQENTEKLGDGIEKQLSDCCNTCKYISKRL